MQYTLKNALPLDIQKDGSEITQTYLARAIGPAVSEVLERGLSEMSQLADILKKIPGKPQNVEVVGVGSDRVKLIWAPLAQNPDAVEEYVVYKRPKKGGDWEEAARTDREHTVALVKGLKYNDAEYEFHVAAMNSFIMSLTNSTSTRTNITVAGAAGYTSLLSVLTAPLLIECGITGDIAKDLTTAGALCRVGICLAALPATILLSPIIAPVGAIVGAVVAVKQETGDLSEE